MSWLVGDIVDLSTLDYSLFGVAGDAGDTSSDAVDSASDACSGSSDSLFVPSADVSSAVGSSLGRFVSVRVPVCMSLPVSSNELSFRDYCCAHTFIHSGCVLVVLAA